MHAVFCCTISVKCVVLRVAVRHPGDVETEPTELESDDAIKATIVPLTVLFEQGQEAVESEVCCGRRLLFAVLWRPFHTFP